MLLVQKDGSELKTATEYLPVSTSGVIVNHDYYVLSYIEEYEQAEWVFYRLPGYYVTDGTADRTDDFREDPLVKTGSATLEDYKGSGYDRGHLCPAGDMKMSEKTMSATFYMSNMSPQLPSFNRIGWRNLETKIRDMAVKEGEIYVVTGPVFGNCAINIGDSKVCVPEKYYKVVYDLEGEDKKAIGFIYPHEKIEGDYAQYAVSVDEVEAATGLDFFPMLKNKLEKELEAEVNVDDWL